MKSLTLNYEDAHSFVDSNSYRGYMWDGWDIVRWVPNPDGFAKKSGRFMNGKWGLTYRFLLQSDGTWTVKVPSV